MARLLKTKATTRGTMDYVLGGEKVPQETKAPFSPLVLQKVPLSSESRNAVEHSVAIKQTSISAMVACLLHIRGLPLR